MSLEFNSSLYDTITQISVNVYICKIQRLNVQTNKMSTFTSFYPPDRFVIKESKSNFKTKAATSRLHCRPT